MKYSRMVSKCCKEKAEIAKEKTRRDDEEEITLQKLEDFGKRISGYDDINNKINHQKNFFFK